MLIYRRGIVRNGRSRERRMWAISKGTQQPTAILRMETSKLQQQMREQKYHPLDGFPPVKEKNSRKLIQKSRLSRDFYIDRDEVF